MACHGTPLVGRSGGRPSQLMLQGLVHEMVIGCDDGCREGRQQAHACMLAMSHNRMARTCGQAMWRSLVFHIA